MYVLTDPTAGKPPGTGAVQKYWTEDSLLLPAVTVVSFFPGSLLRGGGVGVLGLRIVVQDVAASFWLNVAPEAVPLEFEVLASLMSAAAAVTLVDKTVDRNLDVCVLPWRALDRR